MDWFDVVVVVVLFSCAAVAVGAVYAGLVHGKCAWQGLPAAPRERQRWALGLVVFSVGAALAGIGVFGVYSQVFGPVGSLLILVGSVPTWLTRRRASGPG